ncbi:MAG: hypothetical protein ACC656_00470 [Candidatus Heimdallarchaeota archaeon]
MSSADISFLTHEIGSLRKATAFIKASRNQELSSEDIFGFQEFLSLIKFDGDSSEIIDLLRQSNKDQENNEDYHRLLAKWRVQLNIKYKESTGIDLIDSGEWTRREMYQHFVESDAVKGIALQNHVGHLITIFINRGFINLLSTMITPRISIFKNSCGPKNLQLNH